MEQKKRKCYVIMPFSEIGKITKKKWSDIYKNLFKPAIEDSQLDYVCERSEIRNGAFTKDIVQNLKNSYVVLADITEFNPNVMWELGARHALSKRTILVARKERMKIISDMKIYGVIPYDLSNLNTIADFKKEIKRVLERIEKEPEHSDSPVFDFLIDEDLIMNKYENRQIVNRLVGLFSELATNYSFVKEIKLGKRQYSKDKVPTFRFELTAIYNFLTQNYITIDEDETEIFRLVKNSCKRANTWLEIGSAYLDTTNSMPQDYIDTFNANIDRLEINIPKAVSIIKNELDIVRKNLLSYSEPKIYVPIEAKDLIK